MDPLSVAGSVVGLVGVALHLVVGALGMIDKTVAAHKEAADELNGLKEDIEDLQAQMLRIHRTLKEVASNTKDRGFKRLLRGGDTHAALDELCTALDETFVVLEQLTHQTEVEESKLHSLSLPDDTLEFVQAVLRHTFTPSKANNLLKCLQAMRSKIQRCLRTIDNTFQHVWNLYTAKTNGLARVASTLSNLSTSTTLTARIRLVDWLKDREDAWRSARERKAAMTPSSTSPPSGTINTTGEAELGWMVLLGPGALNANNSFENQIVEGIRISHELARRANDQAGLWSILDALHGVIKNAVDKGYQWSDAPTELFEEFLLCLKDDSLTERMNAARVETVSQAVLKPARLENVLQKVKRSSRSRSWVSMVVADSHIDLRMEVPYDSTLAEILWKFYRACGYSAPRNPHFYPYTAFNEGVITRIPPLGDRNVKEDGGRWTERVVVYGDDENGRIRLSSENETITRLYAAVLRCLERPLTLFKDIEGNLLAEEEVNHLFSGNIKCFRWRDGSFVIDPDVKTLQDVIDSTKTGLISMEHTDLPKLRSSTSVLGSGSGLIPGTVYLVASPANLVDKMVTANHEAANKLQGLRPSLKAVEKQMVVIHGMLLFMAINTNDDAFLKLLPKRVNQTFCGFLDKNFSVLQRLTDRIDSETTNLRSVSLPANHEKSLAYVQAVLKDNLSPWDVSDLVKTMQVEIRNCTLRFEYLFLVLRLRNGGTEESPERGAAPTSIVSTPTTLSARFELVSWLIQREERWRFSSRSRLMTLVLGVCREEFLTKWAVVSRK